MKIIPMLRALALLLTLTSTALHAQVPQIINYQGRVAVGNPPVNFDGSGSFKFALVDAAGTTSYWSNDGTSTAGSQPTAAVTLPVTKGLYSVMLGANMTPIPASVFANADVRLRVWFDDGTANGSQLLTPDQRISAVGYAMVAGSLQPGADISAGTVTATAFSGDGSGLTNLPTSEVESPDDVFPAQGMVWIKPGKFLMGSRPDELNHGLDETQHWVTLTKGFWMGVHEVTQAEYLAVIGSNPSYFGGYTNKPVEQVSWNDAMAYCAALTTDEQRAGRIPATWGYRLPTEAEWEYCSRAGARNTRYGHGDDVSFSALGNYAWYSSNAAFATHPVEQKLANPWGLYDMHGNVWEWCQDWYATYPKGSATDPKGPGTGTDRVLRGGSWGNIGSQSRSAYRNFFNPDTNDWGSGFRAVLAPGQ